MATAVEKGKDEVTAKVGRAKARFARARERFPALGHLIRAFERFTEQEGNHLAAAVTYFGFLSFFPVLAVAFAVLVYVVLVYPEAREQVQQALSATFPGLIGTGPGKIDLSKTQNAGIGAGIVGLVGLVYSGTGWVDALRDALRSVWLQPKDQAPNIVVKKLGDIVVLVLFGLALVASVSFSGLATSATRFVLEAVGLAGVPGVSIGLRVIAVVIAVAFDSVVFALLFGVLPGVRTPARVLWRGALLGAVGFEVLKLAGTFLIGRTTSNPVYGAFAIVVGMLVWINLVSRITILAAAWTATGIPRDEDRDLTFDLPPEVAGRLDHLRIRKIRKPIDPEALLYREQVWVERYAAHQDWPPAERSRVRSAYVHRVSERLRDAGHPIEERSGSTVRPGSLADLRRQVRIARRSRRFR